jgi:hypothetical protein
MESKTDDTMKARFLVVRKEIYNRYTVIDTDIIVPGESKKTNRTVIY